MSKKQRSKVKQTEKPKQEQHRKLMLKFQDGKIRIIIIGGEYAAEKTFLEQASGIKFNSSPIALQLCDMIIMCDKKYCHDEVFLSKICNACALLFAQNFAEANKGYMAYFEYSNEPLVYIPSPHGHFIYQVDTNIYSQVGEEVTLISENPTIVDTLTVQINQAIDSEDYERAAKLRDEITKRM